MATYWVDSATVKAFPTSTIAWRLPIALQLVFLLPILALTFMIPESPRWLASHDRLEECHSVVARYAGLPEDDETVLARYNEIADSVAYEKSVTSSSWSQIFRKDRISSRRRFFIACSIQGARASSCVVPSPRNSPLPRLQSNWEASTALSTSPSLSSTTAWASRATRPASSLVRASPALLLGPWSPWTPELTRYSLPNPIRWSLHVVLHRFLHPLVPHRLARSSAPAHRRSRDHGYW